MNREVQAVMLILVGGAILRISAGDIFLRYVKEGMRPFLLVGGAFLVVLGIWAIVDLIRESNNDESDGHDHAGHGHNAADDFDDGHGHGPMRAAWLLLLPVFSILLVAPPALGAFSAERDQQSVSAPKSDSLFPELAATDPLPMALSEYAVRAVWDDTNSLEGRTVEMTGFVTPNPDGGWWLTRLSMACCAADASATKIHVVDPPAFEGNTWVTLTGHWVPGGGTQTNESIPWVAIDNIESVNEPREPYE